MFLKEAYWQINNELNYSGQDLFFVIILVIVWSFLSHLFIYFLLYVVVKQNSFLFLDLPIYDFYGEFALSLHLRNVYNKYKKKKKKKETKGKGLTPKQMIQRLPIALAEVKAGNNSENLLNEIRQIVYSLYQSKQITKKVYNNLIKSVNV